MKTFSFPLESLRTLRKQREQSAQQRYARALAHCEAAQRALQLANEDLTASQAAVSEELNRGTAAGRIVSLRTWCTVLEIRRNERQAALVEAGRAADEAFRFLNAAVRERETLDRFHEKSHRAWVLECQQEEQKMFDELAVQRQSGSAMQLTSLN